MEFFKSWNIPYGIPNYLLSNNGPQFVSKILPRSRPILGTEAIKDNGLRPTNKWEN